MRIQRPLLQVALDEMNLDRAVQIAKEAVEGGVDWIEAGTPLIKSEGMEAVRTLRKTFPKHEIVADMKTMDTGAYETEMACKAGASVVMILAAADDGTIQEAVKAARKYGAKLSVDLIGVEDKVKRAKECAALGVDLVNMHVGVDEQMKGKSPLDELRASQTVQVMRERRLGNLDLLENLGRREVSCLQELQNPPPCRIREGFEQRAEVRHHRPEVVLY